MLVPFAKQTANEELRTVGERLRNCFAHPHDGPSPIALYAASGVEDLYDLGGPVRAVARSGTDAFFAAGKKLWSFNGVTLKSLADIPDGPTRMVNGLFGVSLVIDGLYYIYTFADKTFQRRTTGVVGPVYDVVELGNYIVVCGSGNQRGDTIAWSLDGITFDGLDFATAESSFDDLVGMAVNRNELWLIGSQSAEIWNLTGSADAPFRPNLGAVVEVGCKSIQSICQEDGSVYWVDEKNMVWGSSGGVPKRISTPEVERSLDEVTSAFIFTDRQHRFLAFGTLASMYCYDLNTGLWAERTCGAQHMAPTPNSSVSINGREYLGTWTGKLSQFKEGVFEDDGKPIVLDAISGPLVLGNRPFTVSKLTIRFASGQYDLGRQPKVLLQTSRDGRNWGKQRDRNLGDLGQHYSEVKWNRLGRFERAHFRLIVSDPVQRDIEGAVIGGLSS